MNTISLCMIVKNEEESLEQCLSSVSAIVDEMIIVDTGSTDRTQEIAARFTDKIFDFTWIDDFAAARNFSFSKATMDYILWLDADDVILPADAAKLKELKANLSADTAVVMMLYNTGFDGQGRVVFSYYRERLVKRSYGFVWKEPVHEYLEVYGQRLQADIGITHTKKNHQLSLRNIRIYENLLSKGQALSARGMYYYARELKEHGRDNDAVNMFQQFLDSGKGWVEDNITACGELAGCYQRLGDDQSALTAMLRSFHYDTPRAELCCQIGYLFKARHDFRRAAFWFELALKLEKPQHSWGFCQQDCWGFIPNIECAVCYDHLGDYVKAESFNEKAAQYKPDSPAVLINRNYFKNRNTP